MFLSYEEETALREIYAWGSHYPLREEAMVTLLGKGYVRKMRGIRWNIGYWEITALGRAWVMENTE